MIKRIPFFLALLSIVGGVFISILFAVQEDMFLSHITTGLDKNVKIQKIVDPTEKAAKIKTETEKNWRYFQRFHFHATGIGAMMMGILLFLSRLKAPKQSVNIASFMIAIGGTLYPFVWLFAGIYGPEMGRNEAKEAFAFLGYMGGVFLLGGIYSMYLSLKYSLVENRE
ncbi:MAG: hypothetical protein PHY93_08900 [Bacteriovorax sp.]|nr:hypothetical protein [Bacteriovorax sp.]